jgi:hypothetical protein
LGTSGAGFLVLFGVVVRFVLVVLRLVVLRLLVLRLLVLRLLVLRRRRPGIDLPLVRSTVSGGTDGTSDGIAG